MGTKCRVTFPLQQSIQRQNKYLMELHMEKLRLGDNDHYKGDERY